MRALGRRTDAGFRAGHDRGGDVSGRLLHHAGDFGAVRGRRSETRDARFRALCDSDHGRDPDRAVRGAEPGAPPAWRLFSDRSWSSGSSRSRSSARLHIRDDPHVLAGDQSVLCVHVHARARQYRACHARPCLPRGDRRRGALCRSRTFRPQADPDRLVRARAAGAADQLFRAGRVRAVAILRRIENPFYQLVPDLAAAADGGAGDRGDRDREPGGHHRRLFAGAAGDPARLPAARCHRAYLGRPIRADLHSAREHDACWSACCCWC